MAATSFDIARFSNRLRLGASDMILFQTFITDIVSAFASSLGPVGSTPNANGATLTSGVLALQPADGTNPGVVSTTTQTLAGDKTFSGATTFSGVTTFSDNVKIPSAKQLNLDGTTNNDNSIGYNSGTFTTTIRTSGATSLALNASASTATLGGYKLVFNATDSTGTPGNVTINKPSGVSAIAAAASSCQVTNNLVTTSSIIQITPLDLDATALRWKAVAASGSFTVTVNAAATATFRFYWQIIN